MIYILFGPLVLFVAGAAIVLVLARSALRQ